MTDFVRANHDSRLYVLRCGDGYSALGFDCAEKRIRGVMEWIKEEPLELELGTEAHYAYYRLVMRKGELYHQRTNLKCPVELDQRLTRYKGCRIEVTHANGVVERFNVGMSGGWMPTYLRLRNSSSRSGVSACIPKDSKIEFVPSRRR